MNSTDRPHSARRAFGESSNETKRQKSEKGAEPTSQENSYKIVVKIRTCLGKIEAKIDKITSYLAGTEQPKLEQKQISADMSGLFEDLKRIDRKLIRHYEIQDSYLKVTERRCEEMKKLERISKEILMERDVLHDQIHSYLEQISSLKSKIEEQRCSAGAYERQVNAEYEVHLQKLESRNEDLRYSIAQKDKQLKEANEQMRHMCKMLKSHEMLSWRKNTEERVFITILKNDLQAIWNEKIRIEDEFRRLKKFCGYKESDVQDGTYGFDTTGSVLKRSKSVNDLTAQGRIEAEGDRLSPRRDNHFTALDSSPVCHSSKTSHRDGCTSSTFSRQKMFQDSTAMENLSKRKPWTAGADVRDKSVSTSMEPSENVTQKEEGPKRQVKQCAE